MSDKKISQKEAALEVLGSAAILLAILLVGAYVATMCLNWKLNLDSLPPWMALIGTLLAFVGNGFVSNAVIRYGARGTWLWRIGNPLQAVGFVVTLLALIIK